MKQNYTTLFALLLFSIVFFSSCTKNVGTDPSANPQDLTNRVARNYGLQAMSPEQWSNVPAFNSFVVSSRYKPSGLTYSGTLPSNYLLVTPDVRDQGQIGSCTGFCGAETAEILNYYNSYSSTPSPSITLSTGISTAITNQFISPNSLFGSSGALSPLFIYYVERVVIQKQAISADNGANMVNIGQTLQGTTSNTSSTLLTYSGKTFKGVSSEDLYAYPSSINSSGYNVATASSANYLTAPTNTAITGALSYTLASQSGSTTSSNSAGATSHGYYVITSTGSALLNDVKTALVNNKPVMMGFNVYDNTRTYKYFEGLNTTSYTYNPLTTSGSLASGVRLLGGHAVPIVGYINDATQPGGGVFVVENSWGKPWGNHGFFYLPYSVIQSTRVVPSGSLYVAVL
jgi:C1A family cysteine protease